MPDSPGNAEGAQASAKLIELAARIRTMTKVAEADNQKWLKMYYSALRYLYGDQLHDITTKIGWDRIQCNYLLPAQKQTIALIAQQKTKIITNPQEDADRMGAEIWGGKLQWEYEKGVKLNRKRVDCLQDGYSAGTYAGYCYWDEKPDGGWDPIAEKWKGRVVVQILRPEYVGVDPTAESADMAGAEFEYVKMPVSVDWAKDRAPHAETEIENAAGLEWAAAQEGDQHGIVVTKHQEAAAAEGTSFKTGQRDRGADSGPEEGHLANLLLAKPDDKFYRKDGSDKAAKVTLLRIWFKDRTMETVERSTKKTVEEADADGTTTIADGIRILTATGERFDGEFVEEKRQVKKPKYPYGRYVEMIGNVVLNPKEEDQVWDYDEWPVIIGKFGLLPHTWRALNGVEMVKTLQDFINITVMYALTNAKFFGDPVWLVEEDAVVVPKGGKLGDALRACAGAIIKLAHGAKFRGAIERLPPPSMNSAQLQNIDLLRQELRQQTGVQESMQGIPGQGDQTATQVLRLETNSRIHISLILWLLDLWTLDVMHYVFKLCKRNTRPEDMVRVLGDESVESVMEFGGQSDFDATFDLQLEVGTALPFDAERKKQEAIQLFQFVGPAFLPRLLEIFEVRDIAELLQGNEITQALAMLDEVDPALRQELVAAFIASIQEAMGQLQGGAPPPTGTQTGEFPNEEVAPGGAPPIEEEAAMAGMGMPTGAAV